MMNTNPTSLAARFRCWLATCRSDRGQATAEYALVMLAAATLAGLLLAWAAGTDGITRLMNGILDALLESVPGG